MENSLQQRKINILTFELKILLINWQMRRWCWAEDFFFLFFSFLFSAVHFETFYYDNEVKKSLNFLSQYRKWFSITVTLSSMSVGAIKKHDNFSFSTSSSSMQLLFTCYANLGTRRRAINNQLLKSFTWKTIAQPENQLEPKKIW